MSVEVALQQAFLTGGLERVSWWNGRVLTAEDLADHQVATDGADRRLGRAIGAGVVDGLVVTTGDDDRSVVVSRGLAVDRAGEVLSLPTTVEVPLVTPPPTGSTDPAGFVSCPDLPTALKPTGHGAYLLTIGSASDTRGSAAGADVAGIAAPECGPRYLVAGVQFRLVKLAVDELAAGAGHDVDDRDVLATLDAAGDHHPRARNVAAALLLDTVPRRRALVDPFGAGVSHVPLLEQLHLDGVLTDCDVPLAVVTWQAGSIGFADAWAVRRGLRPPPDRWPAGGLASTGAAAGLATLHQFVAHLEELVGAGVPPAQRAALRLVDVARYLPPSVLLPLAASSHPHGVTLPEFFDDLDLRGGGQIAAGKVWPLMQASLVAPPIDLDGDERVRHYQTVGAVGVQPAALVAADHLSHLALAPEEDEDRLAIESVSPAGSHEVGARITVHGRNFAVPSDLNLVEVAGIRIREFVSGSATHLSFGVPEIEGDLPQTVPLVVRRGDQHAEVMIHVVEAREAPPIGDLVFVEDLDHLDGVEIVGGGSYDLRWRVTAVTTKAARFEFSPRLTNVEGADHGAWESGIEVLDGDDAPIDDGIVLEPEDAGPDSGTIVVLRVTVPDEARRVTVALRASCPAAPGDPRLNRSSSGVLLDVEMPVEPSDGRISFMELQGFAGARILDDGTVEVPRGTENPVRLRIWATFAEGGTFTLSAEFEPDDTGWTTTALVPDVAWPEDAGDSEPLTIRFRAGEQARARTLRLIVDQVGGEHEDYRSFTRIPLEPVDE